MERMCSECGELFEIGLTPREAKDRDRLAKIGDMPYICSYCLAYYDDEYHIKEDDICPVMYDETYNECLHFENITVGMRFRAINPIKRGDGIEFPEGIYFIVVEATPFWVQLRCTEESSYLMEPPPYCSAGRFRGG